MTNTRIFEERRTFSEFYNSTRVEFWGQVSMIPSGYKSLKFMWDEMVYMDALGHQLSGAFEMDYMK